MGRSPFHIKMNDLRRGGKYWDVKIHVQERTFLCHRIILASASEYFDTMFCGKFMESYASDITLKDIESETFEEILESVYCNRGPTINSSNVYNLLGLSEFLQIGSVRKRCIQFIEKYAESIPNLSGIFLHACAANMTDLLSILQRKILENFFIFWKCDKLMELSFKDLKELLLRYQSFVPEFSGVPHKDEHRILDVVIRWVRHSPETRMGYFAELVNLVDFHRISEEYFMVAQKEYQLTCDLPQGWKYDSLWFKKYLVENFTLNSNSPKLINSDSPPMSSNYLEFWKNDLSLHVYVSPRVCNERRLSLPADFTKTTVFSINPRRSKEWFVSCEINMGPSGDDEFQTIAALHQSNGSLLYHLKSKSNMGKQSFRAYPSIEMSSISRLLTPPPVSSAAFQMCGMKESNSIYLYDSTGLCRAFKNSRNQTFSPEEIARGIFRYNYELDEWFPMPEMMIKTTRSRIAVNNHLLYVIGGLQESSKANFSEYVQAYDFRSSRWMELSKNASDSTRELIDDACVLNRKIYVSARHDEKISAFDLVSTKWETIKCSGIDKDTYHNRIVSYENMLWIICSSEGGEEFLDFHTTAVYDPITQEWYKSDLLKDAIFGAHRLSRFHRTRKCSCTYKNEVTQLFSIDNVVTFAYPE